MARKPYNKSTGRDYKSDYDKFQASPSAKKDRASRNKARRQAIKDGKVKKGSTKEVDHKNGNPRDNSPGNKRIISRKANRAKH